MNLIEESFPLMLLTSHKPAKDFLCDLMIFNPGIKQHKALKLLGLYTVINEVGIREYREIVKTFGKSNWYRLRKEFDSINYPHTEDIFSPIRNALIEFKALRLVDFSV